MKRSSALALITSVAVAVPAIGASDERIRGTIETVTPSDITVETAAGEVKLAVTDATEYASVVKSSLSNITKGSYIGTATKGSGNFLVALEVVVFPPSMRGTGEGHYAWDALPDTTLAGSTPVASSMTNGTVETDQPMASPNQVKTSMTNGDIQSTSDDGGAKRITVTYNGGRQSILVPPTAPVVTFKPAGRDVVVPGAHVFIRTSESSGKVTASFIAVGKDGLVPPM